MRSLVVMLVGAAGIAAGAWIQVPMVPVPMTMQTLAVLLAGGLSGRRGVLAVLLYLLLAAIGLPVLAGFDSAPGLALLERNSSGYLLGFVPAALLAARLRGTAGFWPQLAVAGCAHLVILACGVVRLALRIGFASALEHGLWPFVAGALVKSALAVAVLRLVAASSAREPRG